MKKRYARILAATLSAAMVFTSAPTAVFATELSVSEDAVEAEGAAATAEEVAALFPTSISKVFKSDAGAIVVEGTGNTVTDKDDLATGLASGVVEAAEVTGLANIDTMRAGETCEATIKLTIADTYKSDYAAFDDDADHDTVTITRKFTVKCVKGVLSTAIVGTKPASTYVTAAYGTGDVKLDAGVTGWTVVANSATAAVTSTDASSTVTNGVTLQTVKQYSKDDYDVDAFTTANTAYTYNTATQRFEIKADVDIVAADLKLSAIKWPTGLEKEVYVNDTLTSAKFTGTVSKEGTFAVEAITDIDESGAETEGADKKADVAGVQTVTVKFTPTANYKLVDDMNSTLVYVSTGAAYNKKAFKTTVLKKTISDADIALKYVKKEVEYGTTYSTMQSDCLNTANTYVTYTLKDSTLSSKMMPSGAQKVAYVAELKDGATKKAYQLSGGREKITVYADINVKVPEASAKVASDADGIQSAVDFKAATAQADIAAKAGAAPTTVKAAFYVGEYLNTNSSTALATPTYQWYKNGVEIAGATSATYDVPTTAGVAEYYCVVTLKAGTNATADDKAMLAAVCPTGTIKTNTITATISNLVVAKDAGKENLVTKASTTASDSDALFYGYTKTVKAAATATYDATNYVSKDVKAWVKKDGSTDKTEITDFFKDVDADGNVTVVAPVPQGLGAGDYHVYIQFNSVDKNDATKSDVALYSSALKINKMPLDFTGASDIKTVETSYPYGTKISDIKIASKQAEKYGTYTLSAENAEYPLAGSSQAMAVVFTPAEGVKDNYSITPETSVNVTIDKAKLVFTPNPVEITIGDALPKLDQTAYTVKGLAAKDRFEELGITKVELKYIAGAQNLINKVGTVEEAIEIEVTAGALANYTIVEMPADIIVKAAAAPTKPVVKPTPAPVKQSVAAKAQAVKSKATVKVGKKYTLKLKYAAGKKSTVKKVKWTSSKKSVATVSSKGKVTAKKAGKATIYARVYFKDGSMKKIKFTVTVK